MSDTAKSIFRLSFLLQMVATEARHLQQMGSRHRVKYQLGLMAQSVSNGFNTIKNLLTMSGDAYERELKSSEEKIMAIHNILILLSDLSEEDVLKIEKMMEENLVEG
jgi:hypothetical protein